MFPNVRAMTEKSAASRQQSRPQSPPHQPLTTTFNFRSSNLLPSLHSPQSLVPAGSSQRLAAENPGTTCLNPGTARRAGELGTRNQEPGTRNPRPPKCAEPLNR
jgi:hypothetical protein